MKTMQSLMDGLSVTMQHERARTQMTLGKMINAKGRLTLRGGIAWT